jgi:predicted nuclease of predicted toxin-antitoxin system
MADIRPQMLLLIDENVPDSVARFLADRGHEIRFVRDLFPGGTPDPVIATWGNRVSAIVVTWDHDFEKLISRVPKGSKAAFHRLGRISFRCREPRGLELARRWIASIEFHYQQALERDDVRMIVQIQESGFKAW